MRTTLTPDFYQLFAVLLVVAVAVLLVTVAVTDSLFLRLRGHWPLRRRPTPRTMPSVPDKGRTAPRTTRTPVPR
ncbi:hypothetical protein OHS59_19430 [Streptomyces sp. NBC_00414]|uniref:hypothetical protein n=1 Tax=Streptomyces sp. NBC_00414 TaxID=2975739 RepID=UPI002E1FF5E4